MRRWMLFFIAAVFIHIFYIPAWAQEGGQSDGSISGTLLMLDDIEFTPEGVDRFFVELKKKPSVELTRFRVRFFLRGNKVCVSQVE